ncbi:transmembrane protein 50A-like [Oppia nitens]|uniref:transmembrane protein 50A-like n=1 Tax=Oppia nitens TaxID=1686743 RepID=UPI0023DC81A9|nr:transmembrane protein 50A-like [Oppia nitens]
MEVWDDFKKIFDFSEYRNQWASFGAGVLFCTGWWFILDIAAHYRSNDFNNNFYLCGIFATIALIMINTVTTEQIDGQSYTEGCCGPQTSRVWFLLGWILAFISLIASVWILFQHYVVPEEKESHVNKYPGIALFMQNLFIFGSSLLMKYGRSEERY